MKFSKPAINVDAQIALLRQCGLAVTDEAVARHYLRFVGYYRLVGYALPWQVNYNEDGTHRSVQGATHRPRPHACGHAADLHPALL